MNESCSRTISCISHIHIYIYMYNMIIYGISPLVWNILKYVYIYIHMYIDCLCIIYTYIYIYYMGYEPLAIPGLNRSHSS